jgi:hypothetical protein
VALQRVDANKNPNGRDGVAKKKKVSGTATGRRKKHRMDKKGRKKKKKRREEKKKKKRRNEASNEEEEEEGDGTLEGGGRNGPRRFAVPCGVLCSRSRPEHPPLSVCRGSRSGRILRAL